MGKLNIWQWLGVVLLIVGIVWWILREKGETKGPVKPNPAATEPALPPFTQPG